MENICVQLIKKKKNTQIQLIKNVVCIVATEKKAKEMCKHSDIKV